MSKINLVRDGRTVVAPYLPYAAYQSAHALALAYEGAIGKTAEGTFKAVFKTAQTAKQFVVDWTTAYNANRKVSTETETEAPKKPTASKGKGKKADTKKSKPSSTKKGKGKGKAFDFNAVEGKTKSERNKYLHSMLVSMGHTDSRSEAYQAIWQARPWAK